MEHKEQRTLYCGNLSDKVTEDLLYELFLQAGPLENVTIPKEKDGRQKPFAFITFKHAVSVPYTVALMNGVSLYGKPLRLDARTGAASGHNPYLDQLRQYRNSVSQQNSTYYNYNQQDSRRFEPRFEAGNSDYNMWNMYPPPPPVPVPVPGYSAFNPMDNLNYMGMPPNPMNPQAVSYPVNRYHRNQNSWSGKRH